LDRENLARRADKYFEDLDNVEEMCMEAQAKVKGLKLRAQAKR